MHIFNKISRKELLYIVVHGYLGEVAVYPVWASPTEEIRAIDVVGKNCAGDKFSFNAKRGDYLEVRGPWSWKSHTPKISEDLLSVCEMLLAWRDSDPLDTRLDPVIRLARETVAKIREGKL